MPKRRRPSRVRTVYRKFKRRGGSMKRGITSKFNLGQAGRGAAVLFGIDKVKRLFGFQIGSAPIDDDIDMIIAGLVDKKSGYFVPAGTAKLIKDVADGVLGQSGFSFLGMGFGSRGGAFAGDAA